jgi:hypothetical protein
LNAKIELQKSLLLKDFPSGSSLNFYNGRFYLVSDDANFILILDNDYRKIDTIPLFNYAEKRIPKNIKADLETSTIIAIHDQEYLLVIGSASGKERKGVFIIPLLEPGMYKEEPSFQMVKDKAFIKKLDAAGIEDVNIEGAAMVGDYLLLSNRGNRSNPVNQLIVTAKDFWERQEESLVAVSQLNLPFGKNETLAISELCFVESKNLLLFTVSSEATGNSFDDGTIGDSYVGWVNNISRNMHQLVINADGMISLALADKEFSKEKIEGICVESVNGNELIIHLLSDNDTGESKLFKAKMTLNSV